MKLLSLFHFTESTLEKEYTIEALQQKGFAISGVDTIDDLFKLCKEGLLILDHFTIEQLTQKIKSDIFQLKASTSDFNQKLISYCKEGDFLSSDNLKMCSYLNNGLTNKEIAALFNIQINSVKRAQTRIKNKLTIDEKMTLRKFFKSKSFLSDNINTKI